MQSIAPPETTQQQRLKRGIRNLINHHLQESIHPYWLISFHYTGNKTQEQEVLNDTQDLCQATLKTEPLPTSKTGPPLRLDWQLFSESFRLGLVGGLFGACSSLF